jgi:predicted nuclease of predicted toxin-antitoxin system
MPDRFLLDANLSPKIGRALALEFGIDIRSIFETHSHRLPDPDVMRAAHAERRIVITADRDYIDLFYSMRRLGVSVIYLDLHEEHRRVPNMIERLKKFFIESAPGIQFDAVLITVTKWDVRVDEGWRFVR